jgi:hypothetical protein
LAAVQVEEFFDVDIDCGRVVELLDFLQGEEIDVVGGVDSLGCAEDVVGDGDAAAEDGGVFDVVDSEWKERLAGISCKSEAAGTWRLSPITTYSSDAVCSIVTTFSITAKLSGGT